MPATLAGPGAWARYQSGADAADREQIILQYAPLVKYVIGRLAIRLPRLLDYDDVLSYGTIGLIQAVDRFDPSRGVKFESFAVARIRGAILDALRALRAVPQSVTDKARRLQQTQLELEQALGREPTDAELAERLGLTTAALEQQIQDASWVSVSLDSLLETSVDAYERALASQRADDDVQGTVERQETVAELAACLDELSERERLILNLYYHEELTLREIGQVLDISEGRVCQIHGRALHRLRVAMARRSGRVESAAQS
jgi:RNA polymerase sigma factor for flagellar operon FliA